MTDFSAVNLAVKAKRFCSVFESEKLKWKAVIASQPKDPKKRAEAIRNFVSREIKWTEELESHLDRGTSLIFKPEYLRSSTNYRPFVSCATYYAKALTHRIYRQDDIFPIEGKWNNKAIGFSGASSSKPFSSLAVASLPSFDYLEKTQFVPRFRYEEDGSQIDNITDWALKQFTANYKTTGKSKKISKEAIFHYCYAVLHDPIYREKYALNLKKEFPRIPFYTDFWQWAAWGEQLMALHIGYEGVAPFKLERVDIEDTKARTAGLQPKAMLKSDAAAGSITLDSETTLRGIPQEAWTYKLGNRCAIDWVLDQYKEKKPKDPTIREKFDAYRFADYKEKVIALLARVTTVSVETTQITAAMRDLAS